MIVNATSGDGSLSALSTAGEANLAGKILLDIANRLDFSAGLPPTLFVENTESLGEQIQRTFPGAKVVKALESLQSYDLGGITLGYSPTNRIGSRFVEVTVIGSNGRLMK